MARSWFWNRTLFSSQSGGIRLRSLVSDHALACNLFRPDIGLRMRDAGTIIDERSSVSVYVFDVVLAMCLQVTTTHGKLTVLLMDRTGCHGPWCAGHAGHERMTPASEISTVWNQGSLRDSRVWLLIVEKSLASKGHAQFMCFSSLHVHGHSLSHLHSQRQLLHLSVFSCSSIELYREKDAVRRHFSFLARWRTVERRSTQSFNASIYVRHTR